MTAANNIGQLQTDMRDEPSIRASELSYRRLFEEARDGILIVNASTGVISDVNAFLMILLGYSHEELVGTPIWDLGPFKDIVSNRAKFEELQQRGYVRYDDLPLETKDGRKVPVEFISNVYVAGDRTVIQCNIRNITERKSVHEQVHALNRELKGRVSELEQLKAQMIEAQKMEVLGQLAGGIAHDFNNILSVIMCYIDMMSADLGLDSPLTMHAEQIRHASERAAGLTRQLLVFSRKQTVQPIVLDLAVVLHEFEQMLRRLIDENITMKIVPGTDVGRIHADPGYLGQVLMNLVVNARDAMPNGGKLTISVGNVTLGESDHGKSLAGEYVVLGVSDTGTGMTAEVKLRLFEPLFTTKPKGKGTGLGLPTCLTIVQQSGGHIDVSSELGKGTTIQVYFPRVEKPLESEVRPITGALPRGTETVLIVEDEPAVRHLARRVLELVGYNVLSATNGQDGLHVARAHKGPPISIVLTDVIMPLMGGKVMAEWLKTTFPEIKVLYTSGYTDDAIAQHGVLEPGVEFLAKPYTPLTLCRKVRDVLDN